MIGVERVHTPQAPTPTAQIPPVPYEVMPATAQVVVTAIIGVVSLTALAGVVVATRRTRSPLWLAVLTGGVLASFNEPIVDIMGGCLHYQGGQWRVFETFDRPMPVWLMLAYLVLFGAAPIAVQLVLNGPSPRRRFWRAVAVIGMVDLLIEVPVLASGIYVYYGQQPFKFLGFPLYWESMNTVAVAGLAVVLYRCRSALSRGTGLLAALALPGTAQWAAYAATGIPVFSVYNTDLDVVWKWVGGAVTISLGILTLRALSKLVPAADERRVLDGRPPPAGSREPVGA